MCLFCQRIYGGLTSRRLTTRLLFLACWAVAIAQFAPMWVLLILDVSLWAMRFHSGSRSFCPSPDDYELRFITKVLVSSTSGMSTLGDGCGLRRLGKFRTLSLPSPGTLVYDVRFRSGQGSWLVVYALLRVGGHCGEGPCVVSGAWDTRCSLLQFPCRSISRASSVSRRCVPVRALRLLMSLS